MRVVFDTNIYVSAFGIPGGHAEEAYLHAINGRFELFASIAILTETANVLRNKFSWSSDKLERLLTNISLVATVLKLQAHIHVLDDDPDNRILECASEAQADLIVTGDRHLVSLGRFDETRIMRLAEFLELMRRELKGRDGVE